MTVKKGRSEKLNHTFYVDDVPTAAGSVTVTVKDESGVTVFSGPASLSGTLYSFILPAQIDLGTLTVAWVGDLTDTTQVEVIGDYLFETWELKSLLSFRSLEGEYSTDFLRAVRDQVLDVFESVSNRSFVDRRKTVHVPVVAGTVLLPTVGVSSVLLVDAEPFFGSFTPYGVVTGLGTSSSAAVTYVHGPDGPVSAEARGMALELAVWLVGAQYRVTPDNAQSISDPNGNTYRLALPGTRDIQVSVPQVDAFLKRVRVETPGVY